MPVMADPGIQGTGPDALAVQNVPGRSPRGYPGRRMVVPIPDAAAASSTAAGRPWSARPWALRCSSRTRTAGGGRTCQRRMSARS